MLTNRQTRKDYFTTKSIVVAAIFEDSVSRVIPVAVEKNKHNGGKRISLLGSK